MRLWYFLKVFIILSLILGLSLYILAPVFSDNPYLWEFKDLLDRKIILRIKYHVTEIYATFQAFHVIRYIQQDEKYYFDYHDMYVSDGGINGQEFRHLFSDYNSIGNGQWNFEVRVEQAQGPYTVTCMRKFGRHANETIVFHTTRLYTGTYSYWLFVWLLKYWYQ